MIHRHEKNLIAICLLAFAFVQTVGFVIKHTATNPAPKRIWEVHTRSGEIFKGTVTGQGHRYIPETNEEIWPIQGVRLDTGEPYSAMGYAIDVKTGCQVESQE